MIKDSLDIFFVFLKKIEDFSKKKKINNSKDVDIITHGVRHILPANLKYSVGHHLAQMPLISFLD